jgi:hypothetical protein
MSTHAQMGARVRINEYVPLRGHTRRHITGLTPQPRTGIVTGVPVSKENASLGITVRLDPDGTEAGPFFPGEYTVEQ